MLPPPSLKLLISKKLSGGGSVLKPAFAPLLTPSNLATGQQGIPCGRASGRFNNFSCARRFAEASDGILLVRRIKLDKLSRVLVKNILDYVTRRFNASSAGLKNPWGWTYAETPLSAIAEIPTGTGATEVGKNSRTRWVSSFAGARFQ
jgi:hypothetical protein